MLTILSWFLALVAGLLSVPIVILCVEVVAALKAPKDGPDGGLNSGHAKRVAVIVPAHNESVGLVPTIEDIKPQLEADDRLIVVADNCCDDTAEVAAAAGAEVIVRDNLSQIGKGYALGWGISHLSSDPPDFVIFIDADCRIERRLIARLTEVCGALRQPVQACFLMKTATNSPIDHGFAEFAFLLRNWVRPLGLRNLNLPVQLMGTGMIFPWDVIRLAPLASGHLVEDLKLGLDLAMVGRAPRFFPFARVTSDFPVTERGTDSQRQRWVQGHIGMILQTVPRLLFLAVRDRNAALLALTLDLLVPPLSLLGFLVGGMFVLTGLAAVLSTSLGLLIATTNLLVFSLVLTLAWLRFGRDILPGRVLLSVGPLVLKKLRLYGRMLLGRTVAHWVRTDRGKP